MFYEEKLIDGVLMCRIHPKGQWTVAQGEAPDIINAIAAMSAHDKERILRQFR